MPVRAERKSSSSHAYGFAASTAIVSTASGRRSSIRGARECHGSDRKSEPASPTTSSSLRATMSSPQSKLPSTPAANASVPVKRTSTPSTPSIRRPLTVTGSPASSRSALTQ